MMMFIALLGLASAAKNMNMIPPAFPQCQTNLETIKRNVRFGYHVTEDPIAQVCVVAAFEYGTDMGKKTYGEITETFAANHMEHGKITQNDKTAKFLEMNEMTINWPYMDAVMKKNNVDMGQCKDMPMKVVCANHKNIKTCNDQLSSIKRNVIAEAGNQDADKFEEFCDNAEAEPELIGWSFHDAKEYMTSIGKTIAFPEENTNLCDNAPMKHVCDKYKEIPTCTSALSSIKQEIDVKNSDTKYEYSLRSPVDVMFECESIKRGVINTGEPLERLGAQCFQSLIVHQNEKLDMLVKHVNDMHSCSLVPMDKIQAMYNELQTCKQSGQFYDVQSKLCLPCKENFKVCESCKQQCDNARKM